MTSDVATEKQQLHDLIDRLPDEQLRSARQYLNFLCADPLLLSMLNAPLDDEPYTEEQQKSDAKAVASLERGEGIPNEEIMREFGL